MKITEEREQKQMKMEKKKEQKPITCSNTISNCFNSYAWQAM